MNTPLDRGGLFLARLIALKSMEVSSGGMFHLPAHAQLGSELIFYKFLPQEIVAQSVM